MTYLGPPTTNTLGEYIALVSSDWSGTVTPVLAGYTFDPPSRTYSNIISDQTIGQDYIATMEAQPDLIVESLTHSPLNPTADDLVTITAVVKNIGKSPVGASTLKLETTGYVARSYSVGELLPGESIQFTRDMSLMKAQDYTTTATADVDNVVFESNENNNVTTDSLTVTFGALYSFVFDIINSPQYVNSPFSITIRAIDKWGNTVTNYSQVTTLSAYSANQGALTMEPTEIKSSEWQEGIWSDNVTITKFGSNTQITASGGGKSGNSNYFNVWEHVTMAQFVLSLGNATAGTSQTISPAVEAHSEVLPPRALSVILRRIWLSI